MSCQKCEFYKIVDWDTFLQESVFTFRDCWKKDEESSISRNDFSLKGTIGKGGYGRVECAVKGGTYYAIKIIPKIKYAREKHLTFERRALQAVKFPFIVHMEYFFTDKWNTYFVMPYMHGGDFFDFLRRMVKIPEPAARFYGAQILLALEYLHYMRIVYRDLKPENVLFDSSGYIKLGDLGFCKPIRTRTYTFCGTAEYMAPEILLNKGHCLAVDWWSLGVFLYEMVTGTTPFFARDEETVLRNIGYCDYQTSRELSPGLEDLVRNLLQPDPTKRLGNLKGGAGDIKKHYWFQRLDFLRILNRLVVPPYDPKLWISIVYNISSEDSII